MSQREEPEESYPWRVEPTEVRGARIDGTLFEWIERTKDGRFDRVREQVESLWRSLPAHRRAEYTARLQSRTDTDFFSAYTELWFRWALEQRGCVRLTWHHHQDEETMQLVPTSIHGPTRHTAGVPIYRKMAGCDA